VKSLTHEQLTAFDESLQKLSCNNNAGRFDATAWYRRLFQQKDASMLLRVEGGNVQDAYFIEQ
jgi:hypothetical protein